MPRLTTRSFVVIAILWLSSQESLAGLKWVDVGVNGLTCSLCSRSVEKSILQLEFVDHMEMSLEETVGRIYLKSGFPFDAIQVAKAVEKAGFSVRFISLTLSLDDLMISENGLFYLDNHPFRWINYQRNLSKRNVTLKLLDDGFLPKKEANNWKKEIESQQNSENEKVIHVVQES